MLKLLELNKLPGIKERKKKKKQTKIERQNNLQCSNLLESSSQYKTTWFKLQLLKSTQKQSVGKYENTHLMFFMENSLLGTSLITTEFVVFVW